MNTDERMSNRFGWDNTLGWDNTPGWGNRSGWDNMTANYMRDMQLVFLDEMNERL